MGYVIVKRDDAARRIVLSPRVTDILSALGSTSNASSVGNHPLVRAIRRSGKSSSGDNDSNNTSSSSSDPDEDATQTSWRPAHARFALRSTHRGAAQ
ncbi:hypothetical protein H4R27_006587 [Coemansia aciculifera]|nr:hypothetical protein H4R27_006587 [Coemansia aciculifera]